MPIGDNSRLIDSISVGTGIPTESPQWDGGTPCPKTCASGQLPLWWAAAEAARAAASYNHGGLFILGLQKP